jgi:tape measure domain-containing protein
MRFDNRHFESNVKTTMSTLDKLKEKLHLNGASKGLENVGTAAKNVNMMGLGNAVEAVSTKFSALQVMGVTALANITNSAVNAGKRMISALTIDPVKTGFSEYETKINSIQTILSNTASKGTTMEDVTRVINELNTYADKTIYNFAEMTRNIGTFTAAGVGLEESAAAIQGIANLAAASGSTSQQASTAMYQLSQAISTGTVRLMDWNSVVNAGMGGELFQEAIKDTAREYGVAVDDIIKKNGSFRDSLQDEWLTADILNTTLKKFTKEGAKEYADSMVKSGKYTREQADALLASAQRMEDAATTVKTFTQLWDTLKESAQSGWAQTWELLVGDFEEARDFLSGLSKTISGVIGASADARNKMLGGALNSKWDTFTEQINKAGIATEDFERKLKETAKENGFAIDDLITKHGSLAKAIQAGAIPANIITKTLKKFAGISLTAGDSTEDLTKKLDYFQKVVDDVWRGDYGDGEARVKALTKAGYDYATVQDLVNKTVDGHRLSIEDLSDAQLENLGYTEDQIKSIRELAEQAEKTGTPINELIKDLEKPSGRQLLIESLNNVLHSLIDSCKAVKQAWREVFWGNASEDEIIQRKANMIYKVIEAIHSFTEALKVNEERADQIRRTFKGLFAIIDIILTVVGGPLKLAFKAILQVFDLANIDILELTAKVGDAIVAFRDWIDEHNIFAKAIKKIGPFLKDAISGIKDWIAGIKEADNIPKYIIQGLVNGLKAGVMAVGETVVELGKTIIETIKKVLGIHSPSTEFFEIGKNIIQGLINGLKDGATAVWNFIKKIGTKCIEVIKGLDFGTVFAGVLSIGTLAVMHTIGNALSTLAAPLAGLGDMFEEVGDAVKIFSKGLKNVLNAKAFEMRSRAMINMALAIAVLAGSIYLLAKLDAGKLWATIGAIAALAVILGLLTVVISKFGNITSDKSGIKGIKDSMQVVVTLIGISVALLLAAIAMKKLADINLDNVPKSLGLIAVIVGAFAAILLVLGKLVDAKKMSVVSSVTGMMISISIAILMMVFVIKQVNKLAPNEVAKGVVVISLFGLMLRGLVSILNGVKGELPKIGGTLLAISVAILLLVGIIKLVSKMDEAALAKGLIFIAAVEVLFAGIIAVSKLAGEHASQAGTAIIKMSFAILMLCAAVGLISMVSPDNLKKGVTFIAAIEILFAGIVAISKLAGEHADKAGTMLMKMSLSLLVLTGVIYLLSFLDPKNITKAVAAISVLAAVFAGLIVVTKYAQNCHKNLMMLAIAVGILSVAIVTLSFIDTKRALGAAAALTAVISAFALMVYATKSLRTAKGLTSSLITMIVIVGLISAIVWGLSLIPMESALKNITAVSILLTAMSISLRLISGVDKVAWKAMGALAVLSAVVLALAGILKLIELMNPQPSLKTLGILTLVLVGLSAALIPLSWIGKSGPAAYNGIGALAALIGVVGVVLGALGALVTYVPKAEEFLDKGIPVLGKIGTAIGSFVGNILGGIIGGIGASVAAMLPFMGECLSAFMTNVQPFIDGASKVGGDLITGVGCLSAAILLLTAADLISNLMTLGTVGITLPYMGTQFSEFMKNVTPFIEGAKSMDQAALDGISCISKGILMLTASNLMDGITRWITGGSGLGEFSAGLPALGDNMRKFADNLGTFTDENVTSVECASKAIETLAHAASMIPNEGGWLAGIVGDNSLGTFAGYLPDLGEHLRSFADSLEGFDKKQLKTVEYGAKAVKAMAEVAAIIPNEGGMWAAICGDNSLATFGTALTQVGTNISDFVKGLGDFDEDSLKTVQAGADAIKIMADTAKNIPNEGGMWAAICGDNSLAKFGTDLAALGTNLSDFVENLGEFNEDSYTKIENASKAIAIMSTTASNLPNEGGIASWFAGENDISKFGSKLPQLGKDLAGFASNLGSFAGQQIASIEAALKVISIFGEVAGNDVHGITANAGKIGPVMIKFGTDLRSFCAQLVSINTKGAHSAISDVKRIADDIASIDVGAISSVGSALGEAGRQIDALPDKMGSSGKSSVKAFLSAFTDSIPDVKTATNQIIATIVTTLDTNTKEVSSAFGALMSDSVTAVRDKYSSFETAGSYVVSGLATGISNNSGTAIAAAQTLANRITNIVNSAFKINSPSKVFAEIGGGLIEGLVKGIHDNEHDSFTAVTDMADTTTAGFSKAISKISDMLNGNMELQPTITPVLDLSNIRAGAGGISSILGGSSVGLMANVGAISASMGRQNGGGDEIISAINRLRKDIGNLSNTTTIINGVTYDDGSNINNAVASIVRAAKMERRR